MSENNENRNKKKTNQKFNNFVKNFFKFLLIGYLIVFVLWFLVNRYTKISSNIYNKIGENQTVSIPIKDALIIREYTISPYAAFGKERKYDLMYSMLTNEYKGYMSYDKYVQSIQGIDWDSFAMESIKAKTDNSFEAKVVYKKNGELVHKNYMLYNTKLKTDVFTISPDDFIYGYFNQTIKQGDLELKVDELIAYSNKVTFKGSIKNTSWSSERSIFSIDVSYNSKLVSHEYTLYDLAKDEEKQFSLTYENLNYFVPNTVDVDVVDGKDNVKTISFKLEQKF